MHEDTLTWRQDETAKVTLQYSNSALWVGLELYGSLLLGIFNLGLILTTVLPILGKVIVHNFPQLFPLFYSSFQVREVRAQYPHCRQDGQDRKDLGILQEPFPEPF